MRNLGALIVVFLVVGCGNYRPNPEAWPAKVVRKEGFTEEEWQRVVEGIEYFNAGAGRALVSVDESGDEDAYALSFRLAEDSETAPKRAGYAIVESDRCQIEISRKMYRAVNWDKMISVVIHELGHCLGLDHTPEPNQIMSTTTDSLSEYDENAIETFFRSVRQALGI